MLVRAVGWLQSDDAAQRRWQAHRPGGICPERCRRQTGRDSYRRTAAGTARHVREVPRIAHRPELDVGARASVGELVQVGLAEDDGASLAQALDNRRVTLRYAVSEDSRASGSPQPAVSMLSLMATGTPCSAPLGR